MNRRNAHLKRLKRVDLFAGCSTRQLKRIDSLQTTLRIDAGQLLASERCQVKEFIVVLNGWASAFYGGSWMGHLGPGSFFGHKGLLVGSSDQSLTVVADTIMDILVSTRQEFLAFQALLPGLTPFQEDAWATAKAVPIGTAS